MNSRLIPAVACIAVSAATAQVPTVSIGAGKAVLNDGFTLVTGVQELSDGRIVVSDARERSLKTADFRNGAITTLGRNGDGPNEYRLVGGLFRTAGDTIQMSDFPSRRILHIAPNGALAGATVVDVPWLPPDSALGSALHSSPSFIDRAGVQYSAMEYLETGVGVRAEGAFVVASDPATNTTRRVAPLKPWYPEKSTRWRAPFSYGDAWTAAPDGRIARVVPTDYHVEWYRNGELLAKGPPTAYTPVPVTKADRDAWYAERAARGPASGGLSSPPPPKTDNTPPPSSSTRPSIKPMTDADFPAFKPPFLEEYAGRGATVAPNGELWVTRTVAAGQAPLVDVFNDKGVLVRRVTLPPSTRLVSFGKGVIYLVRTDDDGLQWIERYTLSR